MAVWGINSRIEVDIKCRDENARRPRTSNRRHLMISTVTVVATLSKKAQEYEGGCSVHNIIDVRPIHIHEGGEGDMERPRCDSEALGFTFLEVS